MTVRERDAMAPDPAALARIRRVSTQTFESAGAAPAVRRLVPWVAAAIVVVALATVARRWNDDVPAIVRVPQAVAAADRLAWTERRGAAVRRYEVDLAAGAWRIVTPTDDGAAVLERDGDARRRRVVDHTARRVLEWSEAPEVAAAMARGLRLHLVEPLLAASPAGLSGYVARPREARRDLGTPWTCRADGVRTTVWLDARSGIPRRIESGPDGGRPVLVIEDVAIDAASAPVAPPPGYVRAGGAQAPPGALAVTLPEGGLLLGRPADRGTLSGLSTFGAGTPEIALVGEPIASAGGYDWTLFVARQPVPPRGRFLGYRATRGHSAGDGPFETIADDLSVTTPDAFRTAVLPRLRRITGPPPASLRFETLLRSIEDRRPTVETGVFGE